VLPGSGSGSGSLKLTSTITVTVDSGNRVSETNETNNVVTMKVRPPNRQSFDITDNHCTVS
jgi:subtilase family serine protease